MKKGYIALSIAIISEVFGTTMIKLSNGFTEMLPLIGVVVGFASAFYFLSVSLKELPLSLAYAIWSGVGTALTAILGIAIWQDPFNAITFVGLLLIVGGVVLMNASTGKEQETEPSH
ncbi:Multidrug resistance protein EbrB [Oceanobacillus picturae]|uniref:Multidrug resistance protein EbrB n=1 Tax=Oceanobacillus picturae TaxID=171693 RepID=W9BCZ3_9BACI|nr:multidrug efflux SMR transporter [Oceanobacillus picturae]CDO04175.1 Multidrug resistance protein EbrB [Oceanobacillus picturae]